MSRPPEGAQQQLQSRLRLPRMGGAQMPDTGIARNFATLDMCGQQQASLRSPAQMPNQQKTGERNGIDDGDSFSPGARRGGRPQLASYVYAGVSVPAAS